MKTWADMVVKNKFFRANQKVQSGQKGENYDKNARSTRWCKLNISRMQCAYSCMNFPDNLLPKLKADLQSGEKFRTNNTKPSDRLRNYQPFGVKYTKP
jgi:hypothetical protein